MIRYALVWSSCIFIIIQNIIKLFWVQPRLDQHKTEPCPVCHLISAEYTKMSYKTFQWAIANSDAAGRKEPKLDMCAIFERLFNTIAYKSLVLRINSKDGDGSEMDV